MYDYESVGQLIQAFKAAGFNPEELDRLKKLPNLWEIRLLFSGFAEIKKTSEPINLNDEPFLPGKGWMVKHHVQEGTWEFNPSKISLSPCLSFDNILWAAQQDSSHHLNGAMLQYFFENQKVLELIPMVFRRTNLYELKICFAGTVYAHPDGFNCILYLQKNFRTKKWNWGYIEISETPNLDYVFACAYEQLKGGQE